MWQLSSVCALSFCSFRLGLIPTLQALLPLATVLIGSNGETVASSSLPAHAVLSSQQILCCRHLFNLGCAVVLATLKQLPGRYRPAINSCVKRGLAIPAALILGAWINIVCFHHEVVVFAR